MHQKTYTLELAGRTITASFNDLADQANGSVMLSCDNTVVLATAVMSTSAAGNPGYFNLQVEYSERHYAEGKILGARYTRREGRPTTRAVLSSRIIDRTIRPLFEHHIKNAVQVVVTVISLGDYDPTILGVNAASLALATSDIPWAGPIGAVQVWKATQSDDPTINTRRDDDTIPYLDLVTCGTGDTINMIEAASTEITEENLATALEYASGFITSLKEWQESIQKEIGKPKQVIERPLVPDDVKNLFAQSMLPRLEAELFGENSKQRIATLESEWDAMVDEFYAGADEDQHETRKLAAYYFHDMVDQVLHTAALDENKRADLRAMDEVRDLYAQAGGVSPLLHGTGIFYRGGTHVLSVTTLGGPDDTLLEDGMEIRGDKRFFHHYNFPPFSAGETGRMGGANRRAIGHGMLAEKALRAVFPDPTEFPYTVRVVSESMASNGSTSQASICAGCLALMDAGVPIKKPVAGIAMGIMTDQADPSRYKILTDIQGPEDHHGDMDFKVAGTKDGITTIQLDIKVSGVTHQALVDGLVQAKQARLQILDVMTKEIPAPRADISPHAPKIVSLVIPTDMIGRVIGSGGETIKKIQEETETTITIEDDGTIYITGLDQAPLAAKAAIEGITRIWKVGDTITGKVTKILDEVGAIVQISPYSDGLVHISELANFRVQKVSDVVTEGQELPVTVIKVDQDKGRISLSVKQDHPDLIKKPTTYQ